MSTDRETKYSPGRSNRLDDDLALTAHAVDRFRERTPHACPVGIHEAYRRGEDIEHPDVARPPWVDNTPNRARVYMHPDAHGHDSHGWGVVFIIIEDDKPAAERPKHLPCNYVVATVMDIGGYDHGPSKAYLHSHGPHGGDSA